LVLPRALVEFVRSVDCAAVDEFVSPCGETGIGVDAVPAGGAAPTVAAPPRTESAPAGSRLQPVIAAAVTAMKRIDGPRRRWESMAMERSGSSVAPAVATGVPSGGQCFSTSARSGSL
jgi:hypothetical protein